jgi:hypothetical protein
MIVVYCAGCMNMQSQHCTKCVTFPFVEVESGPDAIDHDLGLRQEGVNPAYATSWSWYDSCRQIPSASIPCFTEEAIIIITIIIDVAVIITIIIIIVVAVII